jgi:indole-3-glycerol phosphate synthase
MNLLEEIIASKRSEVGRLRLKTSELRQRAFERNDFRRFRAALCRPDGKLSVIAEIKKASPSAGIIAESFDPVAIAKNYERSGAAAISILTDEKFFQGQLNYLADARAVSSLPLLRKDFIMDEVQVWESAAGGADAILLIVAALAQKQLVDLLQSASKYQLDVLVEVHTLEETERAIDAGAEIIGINNRDLATFQVDLSVTEKLSEGIPNDTVLVSESGIRSAADVERVKNCGVNAILVGEALMRGELSLDAIT